MFIVSTIIILFLSHQPVEKHLAAEKGKGFHINGLYWRFLVIIFLAVFATYLPQPLSPNFLQNQHGLNFSQIGQLGSISSLGVVLLSLLLGQLEARLGFLLGQAAVGLFALFFWQGNSWIWFAIGYFLLGGYRPMRALAAAQIRPLVPPAKIGLAYGIMETVSAAAVFLAPPIAGILYDLQPVIIYISSIALILLSIIIGVIFIPSPSQTRERS